jgi:UDP-N-acetylglucosamine acyltransferase
MSIHPTAIVGSGTELHPDVEVGPYVVIKGRVRVGKGTKIEAFAMIGSDNGIVEIGENNHILSGASLGTPPQDLSFKGETTKLVIGNSNTIREFVTINLGTPKGGGVTKIGNHCLLMAYVHVAHDCQFGDHVVVANTTQFAGHVIAEDRVRIGGMVGVAQFVRLGKHSYIGGDAKINKDIPPFMIAEGKWARVRACNKIGLERSGFSKEEVDKVKRATRFLIMGDRTLDEAMKLIEAECLPSPSVEYLVNFIKSSEIGIAK